MLEVHTQLQVLEAERTNSEYYFRLTFASGLSQENRAIVRRNLDATYRNYSKTARVVIERITQLENEMAMNVPSRERSSKIGLWRH
jgi:hypothetical protein